MRDFETIETGLLAAETGHLVFSTLHTLDATETINRIIVVFPPHQQKQIRLQLASVLKAVVSQRLMPRLDGRGRVPAVEVMITHAVHPRLHRGQGQDAPHRRGDRRRHVAVRDADLRSVDLRAVRAGPRLLRRGAPLGVERGRVQAEGPGHLHHVRHEPRPDGQSRRPARRKSRASAADTNSTRDAAHSTQRPPRVCGRCGDRNTPWPTPTSTPSDAGAPRAVRGAGPAAPGAPRTRAGRHRLGRRAPARRAGD